MRCPHCGSIDDKVIESRPLAQGESIRRRRECMSCGYRFTSYEHIEEKPFMVIKRDKRRQPFDRKKIEKGIERALEKRPVSVNSIENIINEVEDEAAIFSGSNREIESAVLGEMVLKKLYFTDKIAYIRFASVYKQFSTPEEFITEIKKAGTKYNDSDGSNSY